MAFSQDDRPLKVTTPLGKDVLLIQHLRGEEGISRLFHFQLELLAENQTDVAFDKLLGQKIGVSLRLPKGERHFQGICNRIAQGGRDQLVTRYSMEVVPQLWLLSRRVQSRIFQHESVPDILKKVLKGIDAAFELQGDFPKRDYCVQYRESDFDFASRMMQEEGIFYFFKHSADGHKLVLANTPGSHPDVPEQAKAIYEEVLGGTRDDVRVTSWQKVQEIRAGKVTLWDHNFELPQKHLETDKTIQESVQVGKVTHKLKVGGNGELELYDWPGGYAERFDGIDKGGGEQPAELQKLFEENKRVAGIRMQQEAVGSLEIRGDSNCAQLMAGHKFTLERHFNADGAYVITQVEHKASLPDFVSGQTKPPLEYENKFRCIPLALPFRPQQTTEKPLIHGTQTAIVVGPPGETIFPDKYGRVKVQFHWDREGKKNADSSCWVRASQNWGGAGWGGTFLPHVGHEVIVSFEEGDPDRPIITGRVYNAESMPGLELPANKTKSIIRDHGGNEIIMEGKDGVQQIRLFSPTANTKISLGAPNQPHELKCTTDGNSGWICKGNLNKEIGKDMTLVVQGNQERTILGTIKDTIQGPFHKNIFLWVSVWIGGFKTEIITGVETKVIRGAKIEITNGMTLKNHKGSIYDNNPKKLQKTSGGLFNQIGSTIGQFCRKHKLESKANTEIKAAAKLKQQAASMKAQAEGSYDVDAKKILLGVAASCLVDAKKHEIKAGKMKAVAKIFFNNGNLVIKQ